MNKIHHYFLFQMESHCDADCPKAPVACNFSMFGCKERVSDQLQCLQG